MIVKSKKTGQEQHLTAQEWNDLIRLGYASHYRIISTATEKLPLPDKKTMVPDEVTEFITEAKSKKQQTTNKTA